MVMSVISDIDDVLEDIAESEGLLIGELAAVSLPLSQGLGRGC